MTIVKVGQRWAFRDGQILRIDRIRPVHQPSVVSDLYAFVGEQEKVKPSAYVGLPILANGEPAYPDSWTLVREPVTSAEDIPIEPRERPEKGMGSASPRYELHTECCGMLLSADNSLEIVRSWAERADERRGVDLSKLVIFDLGPPRSWSPG